MLVVTATDLPRLMACNGSLLLPDFVSSIESDQTVRNEGDAGHWLIQQVHSGKHTLEELVDRQAPNGVFITGSMIEHVEEYLKMIGSGGNVEVDTSFGNGTMGAWQVNGRADHIKFENRILYVDDFKYGWSIVEPENDWTLIAHAIGISFILPQISDLLRDVDRICLRIFQPRPYHPKGALREWKISPNELIGYRNQITATLSRPDNMLHTGPQCRNCPKQLDCPAFKKAQMNAIDVSETAYVDSLNNDALSFMLINLERAGKVIKQAYEAYEELALHRLRGGTIIPGFTAQADYTNTIWKSHVTPEFVRMMSGKDVSKKELITPNQAKKLGVPEAIITSLTERRQKGYKLVKQDASDLAKKLFDQPQPK